MAREKKKTDQQDEQEEQEEPGSGPEPCDGCVTDENELGTVHVSRDVIVLITRIAALKVPGVVELCGSFGDRIAGMLGKSSGNSGIRVDMEGQSVTIGLRIVIGYGVRVPEVVWQVQNDVRRGIEEMTGKTVRAVNVVVQGVKMPSEKNTAEEEI
ncbi:Asp23/Gls24 family envelope stress response protein [Verrucomicrobiota bacterium]